MSSYLFIEIFLLVSYPVYLSAVVNLFRTTGQGGRRHGSNQPGHESGGKEPGRNGKVLRTLCSAVEKVSDHITAAKHVFARK